jgi:hypothetical protein
VTMSEEYEIRQQRDDDLVDGFRERAKYMMLCYQEWVQLEIGELLPQAQILEASCNEQPIKRQLSLKVGRMQQINLHELPEAVKNVTAKCSELRHDGPYDILEDYRYLQDCLSRLHEFVRELLEIRELVYRISD